MRIAVIGASVDPVCGVRDAAATLAAPLEAAGTSLSTCWWERGPAAPSASAWARQATDAAVAADAVLWHYSVFTYAIHGVPALVPLVLRELRRAGLPIVVLLHELVFPWGAHGVRGAVHAATGRIALAEVMRAVAGAVVTTEDRLAWVASRRWLPSRPLAFVPVVSNVPAGEPRPQNGGPPRFGVFGFRRHEAVDAVVAGFARARRAHPEAELVLVGAPGPESREAARWRESAGRAGCAERLSFTGILGPDDLSAALRGLDVLVFPDPVGPTPRRGTLAAALAHGKPVVAFAGPQTWSAYGDEGALVLTAADGSSLGDRLAELAHDPALRTALGARARAFYERRLAPEVAAPALLRFMEGIVDAR